MSGVMLRDHLLRDMSGVPAVVLDCGTAQCRIGFSSNSQPHTVMRTIVGIPRGGPKVPSAEVTRFVGDNAYALRGTLLIKYPMEYSCVTNWDDMELIWNTLVYDKLGAFPEEHPFLFVEKTLTPRCNREKTAQFMFEMLKVPSLCMASSAETCLFASGRRTGMVVEIGEGICTPTAVMEGYCLSRHILKTMISGRDFTYHMRALLEKRNVFSSVDLPQSYITETAKDVKEKLCYVAMDYNEEMETFSCQQEKQYELPDGQIITVGKERFQCPEAMFQQNLMSYEMPGLHEIVFNGISRCDEDIKAELFSNILLCGGSSLFPGLASRLEKEINLLAGAKTRIRVMASPNPHLAFQGATMIASKDDFLQRSLSREFYDEYGPSAVERVFFQ